MSLSLVVITTLAQRIRPPVTNVEPNISKFVHYAEVSIFVEAIPVISSLLDKADLFYILFL